MACCHTQHSSSGAQTSQMFLHHTSTQQRAAFRSPTIRRRMPAQLGSPEKLRAAGIDGTGRRLSLVSARSHAHPAKLAIIAEMRELNRLVTSKKLYMSLGRIWSPKAIEYHLSILVTAGVVEVAPGPEDQFCLADSGMEPKD